MFFTTSLLLLALTFTKISKLFCLLSAASLVAAKDDDEKKIDGPVIGIDLGTTYSCVRTNKHGRVEIIPSGQGNRNNQFVTHSSRRETVEMGLRQGLVWDAWRFSELGMDTQHRTP